MADYVMYSSETCVRPRRSMHKGVKILLFFLAGIGLGELVYQFGIAPRLMVESVVISGDRDVPKSEILKVAQLEAPVPYSKVHAHALKARLEEVPWIRSAKVEKVFPNKIVIHIELRNPVGFALMENGSSIEVYALDQGMCLFLPKEGGIDSSLPLFSGLRLEGNAGNVRLPNNLSMLIRRVLELHAEEPSVGICFSEYRLVKTREEDYELIAYPVAYQVPVRMGSRPSTETFKSALLVLDVMQKEGLLDKVEEIDFRTGNILYRMRGGEIARK